MKNKAPNLVLVLSFALTAIAAWPLLRATSGDGERVALILAQIIYQSRAGKVEPRTYPILEEDLNAFLQDQVGLQVTAGLEKATVELLDEDVFTTWLTIDMDDLDLGQGSVTGLLVRGLFSGQQTLELEGKLEAGNGQGRYTARRAELNGTPIPLALVNTFFKTVGKRLQPPFDPTESFQLPYDLDSIHVTKGQVTLKTGNGDPRP